MTHFTYSEPDNSSLKQGDILCKSDEILGIIKKVHPHYLRDDYRYFLVLTQSCDLERRDRKNCKAPYITIAAIRPLDLLLKREIAKHQRTDLEKNSSICNKDKKNTLNQFMARLLNNNEPDYFYLHDDAAFDFTEKMVAFLRLSIAIKSNFHYDACLNSKILELTDAFKAKLGWLVGRIYSRVGTQDWVPSCVTKEGFSEIIDKLLEENIVWVDKKVINKLKGEYSAEINSMSPSEIQEFASSIEIEKDRDVFLDQIRKILNDSGFIADNTKIDKIVTRINNDPLVKQKFS